VSFRVDELLTIRMKGSVDVRFWILVRQDAA